MKDVKILTPNGIGIIEKIFVSELEFLMLKINNMDGTFTTYNLGKHEVDNNLISNKIFINEKN